MAASATETKASRRKGADRRQRVYLVREATDEDDAETLALAEAPASFGAYTKITVNVEELEYDTVAGHGSYLATVSWSKPGGTVPPPPAASPTLFTFDTRGGRERVLQTRSTIDSDYDSSAVDAAPETGGAIGINGSNIEGADIVVPLWSFTETHYVSESTFNTLKSTLFALTGKVNDDTFRGFSAGEVLLLGATGKQQGSDDGEVALSYAARPNLTDVSVGSMTVAAVKGWEYLWAMYQDSEDATAKFITRKPVAAYVEQVYEEGDFSSLPTPI